MYLGVFIRNFATINIRLKLKMIQNLIRKKQNKLVK